MSEFNCDMDCLNCKFSEDCINDSDILTKEERELSKRLDLYAQDCFTYTPVTHKRQIRCVDPVLYRKAQNRYFHQKYYKENPEHFRAKGRESYRKHRDKRLESSHKYYEEHKEEILANKKTYYQEHKEEITAKRKKYYEENKKIINERRRRNAKNSKKTPTGVI